jgi:hypothetical protein
VSNFENMTYEQIIHVAILELVQAGAITLNAGTIKTYLQDHHQIRCNLGTIDKVLGDLAHAGALARLADES